MGFDVFNRQALRRVQYEKPFDEVTGDLWKSWRELILEVNDLLESLVFVASFKGRPAGQKLKDYATEGPEIGSFAG